MGRQKLVQYGEGSLHPNIHFKPGGRGEGGLAYEAIRDVPFFRVSFSAQIPELSIKIDQKFVNGLGLFVEEK